MRSPIEQPRVSVVIPTVDAGERLERCIDALEPSRGDVEVIVVDNGSTDGSVEHVAARYPQIHVVRNEANRGYAPACNQGASVAAAPFVLFLNNDALLRRPDFDALVEAANAHTDTAVWQPVTVGSNGELESTGDTFTWWGIFEHLSEVPPNASEVFSTVGAALLVRRSAFEDLGGFEDSYFAYYEESDLCWRARLAGWNVRVVTSARVEHIGSETTGQLFEPHFVRYLSFRNRIRSNLSNASIASLVRLVPQHLVACLAFVGLYTITGRLRSAAAVLQAMWWLVGNRDVLAEQRARTQALRRRTDREIFRRDLVTGFGPRAIIRHLRRSYWFERAAGRVSRSTRSN
jgi:GT2 family glycosyltransferase